MGNGLCLFLRNFERYAMLWFEVSKCYYKMDSALYRLCTVIKKCLTKATSAIYLEPVLDCSVTSYI